MYEILLRNVKDGSVKWYDQCYHKGRLKKNKIILWKSPDDEEITTYKVVKWKFTGFDSEYFVPPRYFRAKKFAEELLLSFEPRRKKYWQDILSEAVKETDAVYLRRSM